MFLWNKIESTIDDLPYSVNDHEQDDTNSTAATDTIQIIAINGSLAGYVKTSDEINDVVTQLHRQACEDAADTNTGIIVHHDPDKTNFKIYHSYNNFLFPFRQRLLYDIKIHACDPFINSWVNDNDDDDTHADSNSEIEDDDILTPSDNNQAFANDSNDSDVLASNDMASTQSA